MFGELPKLFDRNFAIGYFLPIIAFVAASLGLISGFDLYSTLLPLFQTKLIIGTTIILLLSWLGGIVLLTLNRNILRLMEGYGWYNPYRLFAWIEKSHYRRLHRTISKLEMEYEDLSPKLKKKLNNSKEKAAIRFPDHERFLLPTAFGNTIRAFEVYSRVMYGLDAIPGWDRLLAVIPKDYRELVDTAKAQTDFWVNLWFLVCFLYLSI